MYPVASGRIAERWPSMAEGARLLSEYPGKLGSRVQIPLSPPFLCLQMHEEDL
jgi:hypothetical protein